MRTVLAVPRESFRIRSSSPPLGEAIAWSLYASTQAEKCEYRHIDPRLQTLARYSLAPARFVLDRLAMRRAGPLDDLAPGQGAIADVDGEKVAAYRDEQGNVQAVSPICTHIRCVVAFNEAERTWDCPCHGSRFATDGSVIRGPAKRPLATKPF